MSTRTVTQASAAMDLVEAAHDGHGDWSDWCRRLLAAASSLITAQHVNIAIMQRRERDYAFVAGASTAGRLVDVWSQQLPDIDPRNIDPFGRYPGYVSTAAATLAGRAPNADLARFLEMTGARDILGVVAIVDSYSLSLGVPQSTSIQIAPREKRLLTQVALHLEAGLRLRLYPNSQKAILHPDGRVLHAEGAMRGDAAARSQLSGHVTKVERSRTRPRRASSSALEAWSALISGNWGLVERVEADGKRHYAVLETQRAARLRALSRLEARIVELSARGLTGKAVGYALGVTSSMVSESLSSATLKLGLRSRTELVRLIAGLLGTTRSPDAAAKLTDAERDVLGLLHLGWTNAAIARARGRSERTVANQVAAVLRKLNAPSRRSAGLIDVNESA